ncbi:MAG: hypothetical protein MHPSP_003445, partial [Paramarteilia canceri]
SVIKSKTSCSVIYWLMVHSVAPQEQPKKNSRKELKEQRRLECEAKKKQSTDVLVI